MVIYVEFIVTISGGDLMATKKNAGKTVELIDTLPMALLLTRFDSPWDAQEALQVLFNLGCWTVGDVCDCYVHNDMDMTGLEDPFSGALVSSRLSTQIILALVFTLQQEVPDHRFLTLFEVSYEAPTPEILAQLNMVPPDDMQVTIVQETVPEPIVTIVAETPAPAEIPAPEPTQRNGCFFGRLLSYFVDVLHQ